MSELPVLEYMRFLNALQWSQFFVLLAAIYIAPNLSRRGRIVGAVLLLAAATFNYLSNVKGLF